MKFWDSKPPKAVDDFSVNWNDELNAETITGSFFAVLGQAGTVTLSDKSHADGMSQIRITGGTHQQVVHVIATVTTSGGRTLTKKIGLQILD